MALERRSAHRRSRRHQHARKHRSWHKRPGVVTEGADHQRRGSGGAEEAARDPVAPVVSAHTERIEPADEGETHVVPTRISGRSGPPVPLQDEIEAVPPQNE